MYFSKKTAETAIGSILPLLENLIRDKGVENGFLPNGNGFHIIVGDIDGNVIKEHEYKDRELWAAPYNDIAMDKFELTVEHKMTTREIQNMKPELAEKKKNLKGRTYYWGSWIDGGIIVACSGIDPEWDEAFSKMICGIIRAMVSKKVKMMALPGVHFRE